MNSLRTFLVCWLMGGSLSASFFEMDPDEVRERINSKIMQIEAVTPEVGGVKEVVIATTPLRIYTPKGEGPFPLILFIHGGAWVAGNLDTHDNLARYLCQNCDAVVVSVGYQNAPEGKFPVPLEECYASLLWAVQHYDGKVAVVGDSAGGNMATALCMMARDRKGPKIDLQVLINPAPDLTCGGTLERQGDAQDDLRWQALMYLPDPDLAYHPYVSPSLSNFLKDLPPAMVLLAEYDALRADGELYAEKLQAAGVKTGVYCQMGMHHLAGYGARAAKEAQASLDVAVAALREALL